MARDPQMALPFPDPRPRLMVTWSMTPRELRRAAIREALAEMD